MSYSYDTKKSNILKTNLFQITLLSLFAFLVPILFSQITLFPNQLLIGTIVNALIAYSALRFNLIKSLPIILLPSIGTFVSGIVFGQSSIYLLYLIPIIWLGNLIVFLFVKKYVNKKNFAIIIASITKTTIIFAFTFILYLFNIIPQALLIPMSIIQLVTAICGLSIVLFFL